MAASFKKIAVEAEPVARELAKMTGEALKNFAKWLEEGGASTIVKNLGHIVTGLKGIEEWLNKINDAATKHDSIWQWLQKVGKPGAQEKLPGSPSQQPAEAHMGGETGRRYREGTRARAVLKAAASHLTGAQSEALNKAEEAAAKAQKATPSGARYRRPWPAKGRASWRSSMRTRPRRQTCFASRKPSGATAARRKFKPELKAS